MEQKNPFSKARRERKLIDAGIYLSTLIGVKVVQVTDKKTQEKKDKIVFSFYVNEQDAEVSQFFTPSMSDNSHLVKFLKTACGDAFTPTIQGDRELMWKFIQGLEGHDYNIVVTLSDGWNNIQSAMRVKPKVAPKPAAITEEDLFQFSDAEEVNL